ncbi:putative oxidoreductase C-terminal domain-containing protein, partial [Massilibacteroides sp.]|uniref:putative oxidoreductase C-terminal domain-containing protein n=1 Tax=Massilibacteroides sp. TaxID=2034766 RepID=UPI0026141FD5
KDGVWQIQIPAKYRVGHEAHFGQVTENFLQYLKDGKLPEWEVPNMIKDGTAESNIMKLTGHKSSQCFARYNRMTIEENARALSGTGFLS